jgi:hypothetical protein
MRLVARTSKAASMMAPSAKATSLAPASSHEAHRRKLMSIGWASHPGVMVRAWAAAEVP